jgi:hypothetical protein
VEIKEVKASRSSQQNRYVHTLLGTCALQIGEDLTYFKEHIWKRLICPEMFRTEYLNPVTKETREDWRSSADLDTKEMSEAVDKLKLWAVSELGINLPDAHQEIEVNKMEREVEKNRRYL